MEKKNFSFKVGAQTGRGKGGGGVSSEKKIPASALNS